MFDPLNLSEDLPVTAIALSPEYDADGILFVGAVGGVLRSTNGGESWDILTLPPPPPTVTKLVLSPDFAQDGDLFAGTLEDGVLHSSDRGLHWSAWNFGLLDMNVNDLAISPNYSEDETLYAATESGIFRSTNGGRAWREVHWIEEGGSPLCLALSPQFEGDGLLYVGTEDGRLLVSEDRGQTWDVSQTLASQEPINSILLPEGFPSSPEFILLLSSTVHSSSDQGASSQPWKEDLRFDAPATCIAAPAGYTLSSPIMIGLSDGTILKI
jgi:hypothetical protein